MRFHLSAKDSTMKYGIDVRVSVPCLDGEGKRKNAIYLWEKALFKDKPWFTKPFFPLSSHVFLLLAMVTPPNDVIENRDDCAEYN